MAVEERAPIRWQGRVGVPGIFDGDHSLRLGPPPTATNFTQYETFAVLVPPMRRILHNTETGFAAMNDALRSRRAGCTAHG